MLKLGSLEEYFTDEIFMSHCTILAKQYKANNRTFAEILKHTSFGEAVERICSDKLNLEQTDFSISTHDATINNLKIEIKHTIKDSKWWSFKLSSYAFFLQNANNLDFIFLCYVDSNNICYLKYIAKAKTFNKYVKESHYKDYYYTDKAIEDKQCYEIKDLEQVQNTLKQIELK
jgi:hypothetical protein